MFSLYKSNPAITLSSYQKALIAWQSVLSVLLFKMKPHAGWAYCLDRKPDLVMFRHLAELTADHVAGVLQALCFMAGANSIFDGDKLLTTKNNERNADLAMFEELGLKSRPAFVPYPSGADSSNGTAVAAASATEHLAAANQLSASATMAAVQQQADQTS